GGRRAAPKSSGALTGRSLPGMKRKDGPFSVYGPGAADGNTIRPERNAAAPRARWQARAPSRPPPPPPGKCGRIPGFVEKNSYNTRLVKIPGKYGNLPPFSEK